ncbi:heme exporter protein CcmD [Roseospira marina]|uniref:Heme exporter protein D n=1 Tax=Roseospira marina TaxID=140057 RepID=A0A5M6IBV6_9PROT|nr:heme exporter protein CcmD [Roseospira marina]KAA5605098.1 heme exporter protein CcmD [Roseospira marina]MBB4314847.1 heme exporter protein D [Roseospira marina]MBB5087847.1 heme exporter protein D [Roseospira marina]
MDSLIAFFEMGGYALFVWSSYGVAAVVMVALFVHVRVSLRREERALAQLQAAGGGRRRRAGPVGAGGATVAGDAESRSGAGIAPAEATRPEDGGRV